MSQMKGQDRTPEKQLNGDRQPSRKRIQNKDSEDDPGCWENNGEEMLMKDLEELKNKQTEMNNTLEGIHSRITESEEWINNLEDRMVEITIIKQNNNNKKE